MWTAYWIVVHAFAVIGVTISALYAADTFITRRAIRRLKGGA